MDAILVLDFGGQYCHLIARRVRGFNVYSEIVPCDITPEEIEKLGEKFKVKGLIFSGSPSSVYDEAAPICDPKILSLRIPVLGICYGHQLIVHLMGGSVKRGIRGEFGISYVTIDKPVGILEGLPKRIKVWMSHSDVIYSLPDGFEVLAHTESCPVAAFRHMDKPIYGVQWHPEVTHTENGMVILRNFVLHVCRCSADWTPKGFLKKAICEIKKTIGDSRCIVALSGGVDSSTAMVLAAKAVGSRLTAVFIDHGFMREGEPKRIKELLNEYKRRYRVNFVTVNARDRFLRRLKGVVDPEEKRRIIGEEFIRVFEDVAKRIGAEYVIQGTIYPDRIESGVRRRADRIKTHHNVAGLPERMGFKGVVEPLRDLYKDEVRRIAEMLGLHKEIVWRQPFPGPGLAVRIIGEVTAEKLSIVKRADRIVVEELEKTGLSEDLWQYFAVLLNSKSTGVKGDSRAYGYTIAVRAVESRDGMTASYAKIPHEILERISMKIVNEIPEVTRVVYDITHKPPATIEWE